jgi:esterase
MDERSLAYTRVTAPERTPTRWMLLLHGIFGTGGNLRTLSRKLAERQPDWGFVLPDLRAHGGSLGLPPPDSFARCAEDLVRLEATLGHPIHGLAGHSFGGKVALARLGLGGPSIERFVLLDSAPGADPERMIRDQAGQILALLESIPRPIASRESFIEAITTAGHARAIAEWLAMQVRRAASPAEHYELRLDLPAIRVMLEGYFATDCWGALEHPPPGTRVLVVVGGRSTVVRDVDLARLRELASDAGSLQVEVLERAGHWLHADDLDGLVDVVAPHLSLQ